MSPLWPYGSDLSIEMKLLGVLAISLLTIGVPCFLLYINSDRLGAWLYNWYEKRQKIKRDKRK